MSKRRLILAIGGICLEVVGFLIMVCSSLLVGYNVHYAGHPLLYGIATAFVILGAIVYLFSIFFNPKTKEKQNANNTR